MQTEVGLVSRNVVIKGDDNDDDYGVHLMVHGDNDNKIEIEYIEIINGGQTKILDRYPIYFYKNGNVDGSYVRGNSIHHSNARCIAINKVDYLDIDNNVCFNIKGSSIYLQDGSEQNNVIQNNLVINTLQTWILYQSDITPASFYISNPNNILKNNRAAGS